MCVCVCVCVCMYRIKIVYCQGDVFQPLLCLCLCLRLNINSSWMCFLRGPEGDLIKVGTCRLDNILLLRIYIYICVCINKVLWY